jgi:hypothetical protein
VDDVEMTMPDEPCPDCDPNPPHGSNTEEEMDVDDNDPDP